jgi:photosystem II stability/assembly factor-like uncharacterized protein
VKPQEEQQRLAIRLALAACGLLGVVTVAAWWTWRPRSPAPAAPARASGEAPAIAEPELVDVARVPLGTCALEAVSFRTQAEGWVTDVCGHAFHTTDGGVSFAPVPNYGRTLALADPSGGADDAEDDDGDDDNPDVAEAGLAIGSLLRVEWTSDRRAVALGANWVDAKLTDDGGETWHRWSVRRNRDLEGIRASDHVGLTVWACGESPHIVRSRDGGASFAATRTTPFRGDDRCTALSFADERQGWAGGTNGTLFSTDDGGDTWKRLTVPRRPSVVRGVVDALSGRPVRDLHVNGVVRLSRTEGWAAVSGEESSEVWTRFTSDGGDTWTDAEPPAEVAAKLAGGGAWGAGAVFITDDGRLRFSFGGQLVRETPLVAAHAPVMQAMRGREPQEGERITAWTDHAVIESFDGGRSWSTDLTVNDGVIRRAVHAGGHVLLELADGRIWHGGAPSQQPELDRFYMAMVDAHRRGVEPPPGPLSCVATAPEGRVDISFVWMGCYGGSEGTASLVWTGANASLAASLPGHLDRTVSLPAAERQELLRSLASAVERPGGVPGLWRSQLKVDLTWRCGASPPLHGTFMEDARWLGETHQVGTTQRILALIESRL